jgi:hypothetical protein
MAREKECYRLYLQRLDEMFPDRDILSVQDVMKVTGRSRAWCAKNFPYNDKKGRGKFISKVVLASELC